MRPLPNTASRPRQKGRRGWPALLAGAVLLTFGFWVVNALWVFEPGEELGAPEVKDIAVSEEDTLYPPSDVIRFNKRPGVVYVYLAVEGLPSGTELEARVERSGRGSLLSRLVSGGGGIEAVDQQEEQLGPSDGGVAGVVKFALRAGSGGLLPSGNYTVSVYRSDGGSKPAATKRFIVRE